MQHSIFRRFYQGLIDVGSNLQSALLLAIRLFFGGSFFMTGLGKLQDIPAVTDFFTNVGIPFPFVNAYIASGIECIGGACLFLGLGSRLAAIGLVSVMTVALLTANFDVLAGGFNDPQKLVSHLAFVYLFASLLIFVFGPGKVSLDYLIEKQLEK